MDNWACKSFLPVISEEPTFNIFGQKDKEVLKMKSVKLDAKALKPVGDLTLIEDVVLHMKQFEGYAAINDEKGQVFRDRLFQSLDEKDLLFYKPWALIRNELPYFFLLRLSDGTIKPEQGAAACQYVKDLRVIVELQILN